MEIKNSTIFDPFGDLLKLADEIKEELKKDELQTPGNH